MILVIILLLCLLTLCSVLEVSFSSLNIIRIKKMAEAKNKEAKVVYKLVNNYSDVITTILVINCIANVSVSSLTVYYFSKIYGSGSIALVTILLTITILLFTEIIPKILGREYAETVALKCSRLIKLLVNIFKPISRAISLFEKKIKNNHKVTATKDELVEIVKTIKDEGVIEEKESNFIQKAVLLKKMKVQNVMINKEQVSYLYETDSSTKVKECVFRDNHDRIPIITKDGKAVGMLNEVDLLDEILENGTISIKRSMRKPIYVSRNTNLTSCLELLHAEKTHMALVVDRENNFLGIVTIEDVINELMKS